MRRTLLLACALACASPAQAGLALNGGWQQEHQGDTGLDAAGYGAGLSIDLGPYAFFGVSYSSLRTDRFEDAIDGTEGRLEYRSGGPYLGVVWPWIDQLGVTAVGGYSEGSTRGLDSFGNDRIERYDGAAGSLTLWFAPLSNLAFSAGRGYSYIGATPGWDSSAGVGIRLWRQLWLDGGYWRGAGSQGWTAGLRTVISDD